MHAKKDDFIKKYRVNPNGLTNNEAKQRLEKVRTKWNYTSKT